ncbi:MAG: hypothetical protein IKM97_01400 [Clostridia bacterium]|nr:hypothetical protein [Clostridia bacterium]
MKLGTVVYENKIFNLDYMTKEEVEALLKKIEEDKSKNIAKGKNIVSKYNNNLG